MTPLLAWSAPARVDHVRGERWYAVAGVICATFIAYGVLSRAWMLSIACGMLAGLFLLTRNLKHAPRSVAIYQNGIAVDGHLRIWDDWKHFWILQGDGYFELHLEARSKFRSDIVVLTGEVDPYHLRDILSRFIPQTASRKEQILDAIIRYCKL